MSLTEKTVITGVTCDKRGCSSLVARLVPTPYFSQETTDFIESLLADGWAIRVTRGRRFYCPAHAGLAARCTRPMNERDCPVHGSGLVRTGQSTDPEDRTADGLLSILNGTVDTRQRPGGADITEHLAAKAEGTGMRGW